MKCLTCGKPISIGDIYFGEDGEIDCSICYRWCIKIIAEAMNKFLARIKND